MFDRQDCPTIMDGMVVRYKVQGGYSGQINASRNGVSLTGFPVMKTDEEIDEVIEALHKARRHYRHLARGTGEPLGEIDPRLVI